MPGNLKRQEYRRLQSLDRKVVHAMYAIGRMRSRLDPERVDEDREYFRIEPEHPRTTLARIELAACWFPRGRILPDPFAEGRVECTLSGVEIPASSWHDMVVRVTWDIFRTLLAIDSKDTLVVRNGRIVRPDCPSEPLADLAGESTVKLGVWPFDLLALPLSSELRHALRLADALNTEAFSQAILDEHRAAVRNTAYSARRVTQEDLLTLVDKESDGTLTDDDILDLWEKVAGMKWLRANRGEQSRKAEAFVAAGLTPFCRRQVWCSPGFETVYAPGLSEDPFHFAADGNANRIVRHMIETTDRRHTATFSAGHMVALTKSGASKQTMRRMFATRGGEKGMHRCWGSLVVPVDGMPETYKLRFRADDGDISAR